MAAAEKGLASGPVTAHCIRLQPGDDLVPSLQRAAREAMASMNSSSAFILTAVGSLSELTLRTAAAPILKDGSDGRNQNETGNDMMSWSDPLEVVSLVGTFSVDSKHLHVTVADASAKTFGGHLISGKVFTTLELVLGTIGRVAFTRETDSRTGYRELVVSPCIEYRRR